MLLLLANMFSLRLPIPLEKTLITSLPKTSTTYSAYSGMTRFQVCHRYLSNSITKRGTSVVAFQDEAGGEIFVDAFQDEADGEIFVDEDFLEVDPLPVELQPELMPKHVAVIMDGNGRWAKMKGLPTSAGHVAGTQSFKRIVKLCYGWGIKVLTVFAFSMDNWIRPKVETEFLLNLFERSILSQVEECKRCQTLTTLINLACNRKGIQISVIGDTSKLPKSLKSMIANAEETTKENPKFQLILAVSYSGKYDVVQACKSVAKKVQDGLLHLEEINENIIEKELETNCTEFPYPDLLIRTSGELRVSNFLLWQLAYTEFFFNQKLWPDFGKDEFVEALSSFQNRQRRYGGRG
ncbi:dehydrodolichyl diphosphate synthase 2-like isoform X2 [Trifolium pratense]|uniref:dehydrodolichyl diphosphate synthase 2-like isoform X2 n=1 Tax=Trifolium pratense TaxID=57577 RepID=UPI001E693163|nr:dehydrodolichyl diphosphate synthase 2-like isoform X2 [Trifolium pratense]